ncbi:MAG: GxxExxY protein [Chthoniobacteraceae bacterium]
MNTLVHESLSKAIIGAAIQVLNTLKPGLDEKIYENALVIELRKQGCQVEQQRQFAVRYDGQIVGMLVPDLIINDAVIVDAKVVEDFNQNHVAQMLGYLAITGFNLALLVNFKHARLAWKRVVKQESVPVEVVL